MEPLITYHNDPDLKAGLLVQIAEHEKQDQVIKGSYGSMNGIFKGCAIGCSLHSLNVLQGKIGKAHGEAQDIGVHERFPIELGWPLWLAYYEDSIFEALPTDIAKTWPRRLAESIPVGITIPDTVLASLQIWWLTHERFGVINATDRDDVKRWITDVAVFIRADAKGEATGEQRETASKSARAARAVWAAWAAWDARAARDAWAAWAAWAARDARDAWAVWAARDAWDAWAAWAARDAKTRDDFCPALSKYLLLLLRTLEGPSLTAK